MKKKTRLLALFCALAMAASVTACSSAETSSEAASTPDASSAADDTASTAEEGGDADDTTPVSGTITFLSWNNETVMDPVLQGFRDANPDVTIDLIYAPPIQDYVEKFQILYSTGEMTDVFLTVAENKAAVLDNEIALDISYLDIFDRLSQKNIDTYSRDGKVYAFAPDGWYCGVLYNKNILADNGIEAPTNYEEFNQSMVTLKENGVQPWVFCSTNLYDPIQGYVATETISADPQYDEKVNNGELTYADGWTKPMELWKQNYLDAGMINEDALGLTGDQANEIFAFEEAAYMVGASWAPAALEELNPDLEYGMLPWFGTEDGVAWMTGAAGVGWSINKDAKNMDGAKALLEYLTTDEALTVFQQETSGILAVEGIDFPLNPVLEEGYQYFLDGKYYLPATAWKYSDALGNNMTINTQEIVAGNMTIEEFVQDMDDTRTELDAAQ